MGGPYGSPHTPPTRFTRSTERLSQRREGRGDQDLVLLLDRPDAGLRGPLAALARLLADAHALVEVLVGPHVDPLVQPAELRAPADDQGRELLALGHRLAPRLHH